jgi:hypothetical protein
MPVKCCSVEVRRLTKRGCSRNNTRLEEDFIVAFC